MQIAPQPQARAQGRDGGGRKNAGAPQGDQCPIRVRRQKIGSGRGMAQHQKLNDELDIHQPTGQMLQVPEPVGRMLLCHAPAHCGDVAGELGRIARPRQNRAQARAALGGEIAVAGYHPGAGERHMLPGPGVALLISAKAFEAGGDGSGIARGAQAHVDVVELALAGGHRDGGNQPLRQPGVIVNGRERLRPIGMQIVPIRPLEFGRRVVDEDQINVGADGDLAPAQFAQRHRRQSAPGQPAVPT